MKARGAAAEKRTLPAGWLLQHLQYTLFVLHVHSLWSCQDVKCSPRAVTLGWHVQQHRALRPTKHLAHDQHHNRSQRCLFVLSCKQGATARQGQSLQQLCPATAAAGPV